MGAGRGLICLTGGGSCNLSSFPSTSANNLSPTDPSWLSWKLSTREARAHLADTSLAAFFLRSWVKNKMIGFMWKCTCSHMHCENAKLAQTEQPSLFRSLRSTNCICKRADFDQSFLFAHTTAQAPINSLHSSINSSTETKLCLQQIHPNYYKYWSTLVVLRFKQTDFNEQKRTLM